MWLFSSSVSFVSDQVASENKTVLKWIFLVSWLQTELDDTMSCYQLIKTMTKFEKRTNHQLSTERLNVIMNAEKRSSLLNKVHRNSARKMTRLSNYKHDAYTVQLMLKSGCW